MVKKKQYRIGTLREAYNVRRSGKIRHLGHIWLFSTLQERLLDGFFTLVRYVKKTGSDTLYPTYLDVSSNQIIASLKPCE